MYRFRYELDDNLAYGRQLLRQTQALLVRRDAASRITNRVEGVRNTLSKLPFLPVDIVNKIVYETFDRFAALIQAAFRGSYQRKYGVVELLSDVDDIRPVKRQRVIYLF